MSDWDYELQTTALIMSGMAFALSVTMMLTFYWSYLKQAKNAQTLTDEIYLRMAEQDKLIHETEVSIKDEVKSSICSTPKTKVAGRGLDKMVYESEVGSGKGGLWSSKSSSGCEKKDSPDPQLREVEVDIHELKQKISQEVIPYVALLKLRLKQFGRRVQTLETILRKEKSFSEYFYSQPDVYELSPPEAESIELENGSPKDIRVYYEILKQTEKAINYKHVLEDQDKRIRYLQNIARITVEKLHIPDISSNTDTGILSTVDSDVNYSKTRKTTTARAESEKITKPKNANGKTTSWLNLSKYKRSKN